ncbi:Exostosin family protein [Forsythia ovata]|uniref:Exostosin family protein n=1 Tax=Forsythia ovata TaxID=205694 RepID=A0ABD1XDB1_9LAMI
MVLCTWFSSLKLRRALYRTRWRGNLLPFLVLVVLVIFTFLILSLWSRTLGLKLPESEEINKTEFIQFQAQGNPNPDSRKPHPPYYSSPEIGAGPYHDWELFAADYRDMLQNLKIFVYPDVSMNNESSPFARIFLPHPDPFDPKIGNYFSEHVFKHALLRSSLVTQHPEEAHFFFMPFSINAMRNHPLLHSESSISSFVAQYTSRISLEFQFWNASGGADHFYLCCHSVGRDAASKYLALRNNAIQITCSSSYFQRLYTAHKDIALPQVWPRQYEEVLNPPAARDKLVFFAGRVQNSQIRKELLTLWENDTSFSIFSGHPPFPYKEGFKRSRYCLHVKGYEVNTARVSDAIRYGCVPVLISNYYDLPFANILDWSKFSIVISQGDIALLKNILSSMSKQMYLNLYRNLCIVRKHFKWYTTPRNYDSFYMTAYQLWLRRGLSRVA